MMRPQLFAIAALATSALVVRAAPIGTNPVTPGGDLFSLGHKHPAFGAEAPADSLSRAIDGNSTSDLENREATSSTDMQRLESFFQAKMITSYDELAKYPKGAAGTSPWPSSYWPTYEDGINYLWSPAEKMPASEKYARAYGLDPAAFTKLVSQTSGILSQATRQQCKRDSDCAPLKDASACAKRRGEDSGFCIPTWFGICHAWAPAAIEEREPRCPVTKNGVTFQPFDIKALVTQMYDGAQLDTVFTGSRYNGADQPLNLDNFGRFRDPTRRDIGPGFFHIALVNIMGIRKSSMVVDVDPDSQVWNQPVRSYEVISATPLTPAQAAQTFFATPTYTFNPSAASIMFIQLKFQYIIEADENGPLVSTGKVDGYTTTVYYEYVLELDAAKNVIGGEWVRNSRQQHPDFLWFPSNPPSPNQVSDIGIKYKDIRELLDASADCKAIDSPSTSAAPAPSSVAPAPSSDAPGPSSAAPAPSSNPPAPSDPASAAPGTSAVPVTPPTAASPTPVLAGVGHVTTVSDAYEAVTEWLRRWVSSRGRGN